MNLDYRITVIIAMLFLCFSTLFTKLAIKEGLSSRHTLIIFAFLVLVITCAIDVYQGKKIWETFAFSKGHLFAIIGALLGAVALLLYYSALGQGPISIVTPIWSIQAVGVGILGVIFLKEALTDTKAAAVALAILAVWFITRPN